MSVNRCMILRQTLAELYSIIKEEAEVLEECIEKAHTDNKRYKCFND